MPNVPDKIIDINSDTFYFLYDQDIFHLEEQGYKFKVSLSFVKEALKTLDNEAFNRDFFYSSSEYKQILEDYSDWDEGYGSPAHLYAVIVSSKRNYIELSPDSFHLLGVLLSYTQFKDNRV